MQKFRLLVAGLSCAAAVLVGDLASAADGILGSGEYLYKGQTVWAQDCSNHLSMQTDGNLVLYRGYSTPVWWTSTNNSGYYATMQTDGNFVVYNQSNAGVWNSGQAWWPNGVPLGYGLFLWVQNDGNMVTYLGNLMGDNWAYWDTETNGYASHPTSCTSSTTSLYPNYTSNGTYLASVSGVTKHGCGNACAQNSSCKAWVYSGFSGSCTLKSSHGTWRASSPMSTLGEIEN